MLVVSSVQHAICIAGQLGSSHFTGVEWLNHTSWFCMKANIENCSYLTKGRNGNV